MFRIEFDMKRTQILFIALLISSSSFSQALQPAAQSVATISTTALYFEIVTLLLLKPEDTQTLRFCNYT